MNEISALRGQSARQETASCGDTARRQLSINLEEGPHQNLTMQASSAISRL